MAYDARRAVQPLSPVEAAVAKIFADVLGGNSLRLMKLRNRVQPELGVQTALSRMFEAPTVRGIATIWAEAP
jgi:hypothetical protein